MKKIVCDLCGREVPFGEGYRLSLFDNKEFVGHSMIEIGDSDAFQTYDVCDNCKRRLAQFMRNTESSNE